MVVKDEGQKTISTRWVYSLKPTPNGIMQKARQVVWGFEEDCLSDLGKYSPKESFRTILAIIAQNEWIPHIMDIKTAFLQGEQIDREVYIRSPLKGEKKVLWRLNKCVYGLTDASLSWYRKMKHVMLQCGTSIS